MEVGQLIIGAIRSRQAETRWGIGTAADYLRSVEPFIGGDGAHSIDAAQWQKALKDAESRLTYCDLDLEVKATAAPIVKGIILEFDHVLTTTKKDRDGDIMECAGATIDERMPLLWQHIPLSPVGVYLGTKSKSDSIITGRSGILDTSLGRDAAVLVEGKALRISHGFKAYEAEPLYRKDQSDTSPYGFRVKRFEVMEVSLVSIPSNTDAIITAYSARKLHDPFVNRWAKSYYDARPTVVPGWSPQNTEVGQAGGTDAAGAGSLDGAKAMLQNAESPSPSVESSVEPKGSKFHCGKCKLSMDLTGVPDGADLTKYQCPACLGPLSSTGKAHEPQGLKKGRMLSHANCTKLSKCSGTIRKASEELDNLLLSAGHVEDDGKATEFEVPESLAFLATKSADALSTKATGSEQLVGSFEWTTTALWRTLKPYLTSRGTIGSSDYPSILATFADSAIVCVYKSDYQLSCYQIAWSVVDGVPRWSSEPKAVDIVTSVVAKKLADLMVKQYQIGDAKSDSQSVEAPAAAEINHAAALIWKANNINADAGITLLKSAKADIETAIATIAEQQADAEMSAFCAELGL